MGKFYFIDLFCGAGGVTTGLHNAVSDGIRIAKVIACVNHDAKAIKSHYQNHPETEHFTEDIRTLDISRIISLVNAIRRKDQDAIICLWASLECTNFSKAKGGLPRDADSRTLAEHLYRYIEGINPDYIHIENVEEFMSWGPLDEKGKPVSKTSGIDYLKWIDHVNSFGYRHGYRILNSADYGAHTSRKRYFGLFAKAGLPIIFPEPTHAKNPFNDQFGSVQKWKPVKEVLDFSDEGKSIFTRKKSLSEKTLQRIYAGLIKYVAGGKKEFLASYYSGGGQLSSIDEPTGALTTVNHKTLVKPVFMVKYLSNDAKTGINSGASIEAPCHTITTQGRIGVAFISKYYSGRPYDKNISVEGPAGTITCVDSQSLIRANFLTKYHGKGENVLSQEGPCSTLSTKDRLSLVQPKYWIDKTYSGKDNHQSVNDPAGSIVTNDKHQLVTSKWLMNTNYSNVGSSLNQPAPVITANRKYHYIVNPQWGGNGGSVENPCCTIIARQDKAPLYLISTEKGSVSVAVFDGDSETMIKIKEFMVLYSIVDIKMRMLKVPELLKIQGFPDEYKLFGNQTDMKKFIGNSVTPIIPERWIEILYKEIIELRKAA